MASSGILAAVISNDSRLEEYNASLENTAKPTDPKSVKTMADQIALEHELDMPEGGLQAWLVVIGAICSGASGMGFLNSAGVFESYLSNNQLSEYSTSDIGWIFSVGFFLVFFSGVQVGPIFDRYGPTYLMIAGSTLLVASAFLAAESTEYYQFMLTMGVCYGLGTGLMFSPSITIVGHYFLKKRGMATGIATLGGCFGGIIYPIILSATFPRYGWAWSLRIIGFIFAFLCLIAIFLMKSRLPPKVGKKALVDVKSFKELRFSLCTFAMFLTEFALFIPLTYLPSFGLHIGMSPTAANWLQSALSIGSVFGRWIPGMLADKYGRFNLLCLCTMFSCIVTLAFWLPSPLASPLLIVYAFLFGFGSGSFISLAPVAIGQISSTQEYGTRSGTAYSVVAIATLIGVPISGAIMEANGGEFTGVIFLTAAVVFLASVFFYLTRVNCVGWGSFRTIV